MSKDNMIFVFGSNLAGRHGKGAALTARNLYGAQRGVGVGRTGDSYAIPTKDHDLKVLPLDYIRQEVENFKIYAATHETLTFLVTRIGCGLAGYSDRDIAPMFEGYPKNCQIPEAWKVFHAK
jgi:hypothetical protein